jgi:uncharacterized membrane protein YfcA
VLPLVTLLVISFVAGYGGALLGLGGGILIVPALTLGMGLPIRIAIGASLVSVVATSAGASAAFVRDGFTNLRVAITLEVATVTGSLIGSLITGLISPRAVQLIFGVVLAASAIASLRIRAEGAEDVQPDALSKKLGLGGRYPGKDGVMQSYEVTRVPLGATLMLIAGATSGLLGIGAGALKVAAMDVGMKLPLKVSSATSNFMIGVTAAAGALVYLVRGDVSAMIAGPVAFGVASGAILGGRALVKADTRKIRRIFVVVLCLISLEMVRRAVFGR